MGTSRAFGFLLAAGLVAPALSVAHGRVRAPGAGALVSVSVEVDGRVARLYPAPDGSDRLYLEAREGSCYAVRLHNRTSERVGVELTVDGLNAISGTRERGRGRMYVLDPWGRAEVRGWRTSLDEVRRFTFVDEETSYAKRSGQASSRMGWIEVAVYREVRALRPPRMRDQTHGREDRSEESEADAASDSASAPSTRAAEPSAGAEVAEGKPGAGRRRGRSYPGTGWGESAHDPVVLVSFDPAASPAERVTLRYEYREALFALGVLPHPPAAPDRLWERERGEPGFAQPPPW